MQSSEMIVLDNLNQLMSHASSCPSRSGGSPTSSIGDVLQLNQSCHRSTTRSNISSYLWTCVIVSSWSTLGTIKPDLLGVNLLIRHHFILSENESFPKMILLHFLLLS
ncbi:hypothetical protein CHARACLAT_028224, partial [Characodon lateralis]|nr:hypothetical protein [Characodon lateralis]